MLFESFDLILARDYIETAKLARLGARIGGTIDLKFGASKLPRDENLIARLGRRWEGRPVILAASTHPGEDELILQAFLKARETSPAAILIIAPRHPARGEAIAQLARGSGFRTARRSVDDDFGDAAVIIADTIGDLGTWYSLATLALIGGSWVAGVGGHNPLEPARLGCPVVAGPYTDGWPVYADLAKHAAALIVLAAGLSAAMDLASSDPTRLAGMADRARAFVADGDERVLTRLDRTLELLP